MLISRYKTLSLRHADHIVVNVVVVCVTQSKHYYNDV